MNIVYFKYKNILQFVSMKNMLMCLYAISEQSWQFVF